MSDMALSRLKNSGQYTVTYVDQAICLPSVIIICSSKAYVQYGRQVEFNHKTWELSMKLMEEI